MTTLRARIARTQGVGFLTSRQTCPVAILYKTGNERNGHIIKTMSLRLPLLITAYQPLYWKKKDFIAIIIRAVNWRMVKVWQQSHRFKTWYRFTAWKNHSGVAVSFSAAVDSLWSVPAPLHEASRAPAAHPVSIKELEESKNLCRVITRDYHWTCFQYLYCIVLYSTARQNTEKDNCIISIRNLKTQGMTVTSLMTYALPYSHIFSSSFEWY